MEMAEIKTIIERDSKAIGDLGATFTRDFAALQNRIDDMEAAGNRQAIYGPAGGGPRESEDQRQHRKSFVDGFLRKGNETGLADIEAKAMQVSIDPSGGYLVPAELDRTIENLLVETSPIRSISRVVSIETSDWKTLVNRRGTASGWTGETSARALTATPQLGEIAPVVGEIFAQPAISHSMSRGSSAPMSRTNSPFGKGWPLFPAMASTSRWASCLALR